jgi:hypothetical protein
MATKTAVHWVDLRAALMVPCSADWTDKTMAGSMAVMTVP